MEKIAEETFNETLQMETSADQPQIYEELLENFKLSQMKIAELYEALQEKEEQVLRFQAACQHFDDLQSEIDAQSEATNAVMAKASQWYHENKMLKRQSAMLLSALQDKSDVWLTEESQANTAEHDEDVHSFLNDMKERLAQATYNQLQAEKQVELVREKLKQSEKMLEDECFAHELTREKLDHQQTLLNRLQRVSMIAVDEFQQIQEKLDEERSTAAKAKECIEEVKRERNALARQSAILMATVGADKKLMDAAMELERLTMIVEKQAKELEEKTKNVDDWKKKWEKAAKELQWMSEECQKLQDNDKNNVDRIHSLEKEVHNLQNQLATKTSLTAGPAAPPPPPPPPPPPMPSTQWSWNPIGALMSAIGLSRPATKKQMATVLPDVRKQAMDDIMQKIERGEFRLRSVRATVIPEVSTDNVRNPAIEEMRVLASLKPIGSMRNLNWTRESAAQPNYTGSLRLTSSKYPYTCSLNNRVPKGSATLSPELEYMLSKRRKAIESEKQTSN